MRFRSVVPIAAQIAALSVCASVTAQTAPPAAPDWAKEQRFWSYRRFAPQPRPTVKDPKWPRVPLDYFVASAMEQKGLKPAPEADRRTFIRRITFDLTGLPPTPNEVDAFVSDHGTGAVERLVDRLLASPRFGERMASMWLPLARYAYDQAHQVGDDTHYFYPNAGHYRDWVIEAFNRDLPYDQFIRLQLAADKILPAPKSETIKTAAVGDSPPRQPDLAALGFLGLGPKYYDRENIGVMADEWDDRVDTVTRAMLGLTVSCARCHDHKFDAITARDYYALAGVFASTKMVNRRPDGTPEKDDAKAEKMDPATLHVVEDGTPRNLNVFVRGNPEQKGPTVERRFLRVLCPSEPAPFKDGSGRRELAEAIASPSNPLTSRVIVNRLWGVVFGRPLVTTPSNFGRMGALPTHPRLLDDLAARFVENGWSMKTSIREMVLSATYRQSAALTTEKRLADPGNTYLSRANRRRLTVEQWRDAVLYASGELKWDRSASTDPGDIADTHRTVCARVSRLSLNPMLALFDYPDANVHAEKRSVTTTPTQKLFMMNSPFVLARAHTLAVRLTADPAENDAARVRRAYQILFGRNPEQAEQALAVNFLRKPAASSLTRWDQYAQALLMSNEMLYVD